MYTVFFIIALNLQYICFELLSTTLPGIKTAGLTLMHDELCTGFENF